MDQHEDAHEGKSSTEGVRQSTVSMEPSKPHEVAKVGETARTPTVLGLAATIGGVINFVVGIAKTPPILVLLGVASVVGLWGVWSLPWRSARRIQLTFSALSIVLATLAGSTYFVKQHDTKSAAAPGSSAESSALTSPASAPIGRITSPASDVVPSCLAVSVEGNPPPDTTWWVAHRRAFNSTDGGVYLTLTQVLSDSLQKSWHTPVFHIGSNVDEKYAIYLLAVPTSISTGYSKIEGAFSLSQLPPDVKPIDRVFVKRGPANC